MYSYAKERSGRKAVDLVRVICAVNESKKSYALRLSPEVLVMAIAGEFPFNGKYRLPVQQISSGVTSDASGLVWSRSLSQIRLVSMLGQRNREGRKSIIRDTIELLYMGEIDLFVWLDDVLQWIEATKHIDFQFLEWADTRSSKLHASLVIPTLQASGSDVAESFLMTAKTRLYTDDGAILDANAEALIKCEWIQCIKNKVLIDSFSFTKKHLCFDRSRIYSQEFIALLPAWAKLEPEPKEG